MAGCDVLFRRFFLPWYQGVPEPHQPTMTRPDLEVYEDDVGRSAADLTCLDAAPGEEQAARVQTMVNAARQDWPSYLQVSSKQVASVRGITAFDRYWTRSRIAEVIRSSDPADFSNDFLIICCELGAVIGEVLRARRRDVVWLYASPYWESALWDAASGTRVNVFHWGIKRMSAYGAEDGLRGKLAAAASMVGASRG